MNWTSTNTWEALEVKPHHTIKNNDPGTTFYTLSILELEEMCETYHEDYDEIDNKHSAIEMLVDYIISYRKDL